MEMPQQKTQIARNNVGTIQWAENGPDKYFSRQKYIILQYNLVKALFGKEIIRLLKVGTDDMTADFVTELVGPSSFALSWKIGFHQNLEIDEELMIDGF